MTSRRRREALLQYVMRCRRRLQWLLFVRHASLIVPTLMSLAAAIVFALRADRLQAAAWLGGAVVLGLAAAACAAAWLTPSTRSTAAELDKDLQLEDRVVTALQFLSDDDPVAGLIVRDAVDRVSGIVPANVFRLDLRVNRRAALLPAAAALVAAALSIAPEAGRRTLVARFGGEALAGSGRLVGKQRDGDTRERTSETSSAVTSAAERRDKANAIERVAARGDDTSSSSPRATDAESASTVDRSPEESRSAAEGIARGAAPAGAASAGQEPHRGGDGAPTDRSRIAYGGARGSRRGAGSSGVAAATDPQGPGGGGVRGGPGSEGFVDGTRTTGLPAHTHPAGYHAAWTRVQASLARNDVPASFRIYLRDYFVAIRPTERE